MAQNKFNNWLYLIVFSLINIFFSGGIVTVNGYENFLLTIYPYLTIYIPILLLIILNIKQKNKDLLKLYIISFVFITLIPFFLNVLSSVLLELVDVNIFFTLMFMVIGGINNYLGLSFKMLLSLIVNIILLINILKNKKTVNNNDGSVPNFNSEKTTTDNDTIKKSVKNILIFTVLFFVYYFIIVNIFVNGFEIGVTLSYVILGMGLSLILSLITIIMLNNKKSKQINYNQKIIIEKEQIVEKNNLFKYVLLFIYNVIIVYLTYLCVVSDSLGIVIVVLIIMGLVILNPVISFILFRKNSNKGIKICLSFIITVLLIFCTRFFGNTSNVKNIIHNFQENNNMKEVLYNKDNTKFISNSEFDMYYNDINKYIYVIFHKELEHSEDNIIEHKSQLKTLKLESSKILKNNTKIIFETDVKENIKMFLTYDDSDMIIYIKINDNYYLSKAETLEGFSLKYTLQEMIKKQKSEDNKKIIKKITNQYTELNDLNINDVSLYIDNEKNSLILKYIEKSNDENTEYYKEFKIEKIEPSLINSLKKEMNIGSIKFGIDKEKFLNICLNENECYKTVISNYDVCSLNHSRCFNIYEEKIYAEKKVQNNINFNNSIIKELEIQKNNESVYITEESLSKIDINYNERFFEYGWVIKRNGEQILARAIHPGEFTLNFKDLKDEFYKPTGNYEIYLDIYSQNEKKYVKASNSLTWYNE